MPLHVCGQFPGLALILKPSQSLILLAFKKCLPQEGQQTLHLSLPDWKFALIIPLFSCAASDKPVSFSVIFG